MIKNSKLRRIEDDGGEDAESRQYVHITKKTSVAHTFRVYLLNEIAEPENYLEVIDTLSSAGQNDVVEIFLNNNGGLVTTGLQIIHAMQASPATVITIVDGAACSMAALIAVAGDDLFINEHGYLMFHNYSGGTYGKGNEVIAHVEHSKKWFDGILNDYCFPFLSRDEIKEMIAGKDFWIGHDDSRKRWNKVLKARKTKPAPAVKGG